MVLLDILIFLAANVVGFVAGRYWPRLFPKYPRGTRVVLRCHGEAMRCAYLRRVAIGFHRVQVLPGDDLGWDGREITARTRDLERAS